MNEQNEPAGALPPANPEIEPSAEQQRESLAPRVYVASLSDYNAGRLHGQWIDAAQEPEEIHADIASMLSESRESGAEEWAIHDFEGFGPLRLSEYESPEYVTAVARGIVEHGQAFAAWAALVDGDRQSLGGFSDSYLGEWESVEAYAESMLDDLGIEEELDRVVPAWVRPYVQLDTEAFARDIVLGGDVSSAESPSGAVWLFDRL